MSINPATPVVAIEPVLHLVDLVLVMSVNPGFGGQRFLPEVLPKVEQLARVRAARGLDYRLEVDGGIDTKTIVAARAATSRSRAHR